MSLSNLSTAVQSEKKHRPIKAFAARRSIVTESFKTEREREFICQEYTVHVGKLPERMLKISSCLPTLTNKEINRIYRIRLYKCWHASQRDSP